jgi:hypothetical protein
VRRLLGLVLVVALLLCAGDVVARLVAQRQLERRIDRQVAGANARVRISEFPFVAKLAAGGRIAKITAHLDHAATGDFVLDRVDLSVTAVRVNRNALLRDRRLQIESIDTGTVTAAMSQADFDRLAGVAVTFGDGVARVTTAGVTVTAHVSIVNNRLRIVAAGIPVSVPIPALPVLPCLADVRIVPGHLIATCTFPQVPPALLEVTG